MQFNSFIILSFIAILSTFYSDIIGETCSTSYTNDKCVGFNETCGYINPDNTIDMAYCEKGYYCDNWFSNSTKRCLRIHEENEWCNIDIQCGPYSCYENKCQDYSYAYLGESCEYTYQCATDDLVCDSEIQKCILKNSLCDSRLDCPIDQYCNGVGLCVDRLKIGDECDNLVSSSPECPYFSSCSKNNDDVYVCTEYYSKSEGDVCQSDEECNPDNSLLCGYNGVCVRANFTTEATSSDYNCNITGNSCQVFESCYCFNKLGEGTCILNDYYTTNDTTIECNRAYKSFYQCINDNECQSSSASAKKCAYTKCAAEYCHKETVCEQASKVRQVEGCGDYVTNKLCDYLGASSTITIPLMSIIALVSIICATLL